MLAKMSRRPKSHLFLSVIFALVSGLAALELPYEVLDSVMELSDVDQDFTDLTRVNVSDDQGPTRPIYRLDLDPDYIAYYEIDTGNDYVVLSSGRKTGDFREVERGPDPRPTDVLIQQAQEHGQRCDKFYRLSPIGLTICKDNNATVVAATYNWTSTVPWIEDWQQLDHMVKESLDAGLKSLWQERAVHRRTKTDWATSDIVPKEKEKTKANFDEEALSPGSLVKIALGEHFRSASVYITNVGNSRIRPSSRSEWQQKLCNVLVELCSPNRKTEVNPSAIMETPNHLLYLKLEVHGNRTLVGNLLQWHEIGFVVEIAGPKNEVIRKHFAINLRSKRSRRSVSVSSIHVESDFPDYNQHTCCGGCMSGCSPVAWAQVFGYYDRRASLYYNSIFSSRLYGGSSNVAPLIMKDEIKPFVEDIRSRVETYCNDDGGGATSPSKMNLIAPWFRARQGSKSWVISYLESGTKGSTASGSSVRRGSRSWIESKGVEWIKTHGYPIVLSFETGPNSAHSAVATKVKKTSRRYRHCVDEELWWGSGRRVCTWKIAYDYEFFLHYGWGGSNNKWMGLNPFSAHVAYVTK